MIHSTLRLGLVAVMISGAAGLALANGASEPAATLVATDVIACGISTATDRGMMKVEGVFQSPTALSGEYRFAFKSSGNGGSTNISQGGAFTASAGDAVAIGSVMVNAGSKIDVTLTVTANGKTYDCSQPVTTQT
jgi:hypothetical protein